ncbi:MAG: hypothetical protein IJ604_14890 [Prevotella sp.]|nr:hypothetical protein [Prevotella sp.]
MKNIVFILAVLLIVSCSKTPEEKASALIQEKVKSSLYHPESYEAVETVIDSAFAPKDDPAFYEKTLKYYHLSQEVLKYEEEVKRSKRKMALWQNAHDAYGKNEYDEAEEEYNSNSSEVESLMGKLQKIGEDLKMLVESGRRFIGFKATHKYRANNNRGNTLLRTNFYIIDPELSAILAEYDCDSEDFQFVQLVYQQWEEEAEKAKE